MAAIHLQNVSKSFDGTLAVNCISLSIESSELFFLLGPSGCGKTTLLRMLAGFVAPDSGDIFFGNQRVTDTLPRTRDAGMVFQTYALWPHLNVFQNVAYGLRVRKNSREQISEKVQKALQMVRLEGYEERRPTQLSGGQQQRVALARALVVEPKVLLLDEPLSNLDTRLRDEMRDEIRRLHEETGLTMVYVTHDQKEALTLADRLAVLDKGQVMQVGKPAEVYARPASRFIAGFLGESNFLPATVRSVTGSHCTLDTEVGPLVGRVDGISLSAGSAVVCSLRPQALNPVPDKGVENQIRGTIDQTQFLGDRYTFRILAGTKTPLTFAALSPQVRHLKVGDEVRLGIAPEDVVVLPPG